MISSLSACSFFRSKLFLLLAVCFVASPFLAADASAAEQPPRFGGPNAVPNQLESDVFNALKGWGTSTGERWDGWKKELQQQHGFGFGMDYTGVYFQADDAKGLGLPAGTQSDKAAAGNLRLFGNWDLLGRDSGNTGSLVWKVESRHNYSSSPTPARTWAALDLGYVGLVGPPFNDDGFRIQNLYWKQRFGDGRYSLVAGTIDVTDFLDVYGMISPWLHFSNFAFSTGSAAIDLPNDGGFGAGIGAMLTDNIYFIGSIQDANGDPEEPWESVGNFFSDNEYFTSAEIGWSSGQGYIYLDNYHVTLWHKDKREEAGKPSGWGANFSFARFVDETWMPFLRGGWSDGGDSLLQKSLSAGVGYRLRNKRDLLGFGLNWGEPNENQGAGTDSQYAGELFYRLQVGKRVQLTADLQYVKDPAASTRSSIWVAGARARLAF
jgi:porin